MPALSDITRPSASVVSRWTSRLLRSTGRISSVRTVASDCWSVSQRELKSQPDAAVARRLRQTSAGARDEACAVATSSR